MILLGSIHRKYLQMTLEKREREFELYLADLPTPEQQDRKSIREEFFDSVADIELKQPYFDPCPFQVVDKTSVSELHLMFSMVWEDLSSSYQNQLGPSHAYITSAGHLVGIITRNSMMKKTWEFANQKG